MSYFIKKSKKQRSEVPRGRYSNYVPCRCVWEQWGENMEEIKNIEGIGREKRKIPYGREGTKKSLRKR